ncbi:MAG: outer membrane lipoprotein carrier protein LolA [Azonexaceae bacterium]|uniref:LolA family protein n=1 Tax=Azonexus sp. R2A61 TaxID=2744443 RepID=UPI001F2F1237|nr:outer membrane lipoprotein carrier protein LolA [Azonexus sp. R2A61]MCE1239449.1 outer membrane lipoprotein carrier protein LolA [Azonexaceae bacterium]
MIRRLCSSVFLAGALLLAPFAAHAFELGELMRLLAAHPGGKARFVETRYLAVLDKPLVARGEMTYTPPNRLEKRTLAPKAETLILDRDLLTLERGQQKLSINLASQPEALAFVDSIRGTLAGDRAALERNYALHLSGSQDKWVLTLLPRDQKIAGIVQRITVRGSQRQTRSIEYLQADGDRVELAIEPVGER